MNKLFVTLLFFGITTKTFSQDSAQFYFSKAKEARDRNDSVRFYQFIKKAVRIHPYHPGILYQSALASAKIRNEAEALDFLKRAVRVNANSDLDNPAFKLLQNDYGFKKIKALRDDLKKTVVNSDTAFTIPDKSLHIECIASTKNGFYLGSIHKRKIIFVDNKGTVRDFTSEGQDGLASVFGIKVDENAGVLWACSSPMREMENFDSTVTSGVYKYDLKTKKLVAKFTPNEKDIKEFVFGDLLLSKTGEVFVSDSKNNIVFKVNEKYKSLDRFYWSKEFWNLQGISFSDDGGSMFIADYIKGLYKIDMKSKMVIKLNEPSDLSLKSVDGLTFYKGSLIAIQNGISPMRVVRYYLSKDFSSIVKAEIIDKAHPAFNEPTIGCISKDNFYYVANSLWSGYTKEGNLKPEQELQEVVILKAKL